jgi:F420-dependent oxidoreductase-like protein
MREGYGLKFGIQHPNFSYDGKGSEIVDSLRRVASEAERFNFDSFWVMDHFHQIEHVGAIHEPMLESWTTLGTMAGVTSKIKLGTMVTGIVYRHPSVLAKIGATLDVLSKGRLFMGIGAAWNEQEAAAYGIQFPSTSERFQRLEEAVQIIHKMWNEECATFEGQFYQIHDAYCNPKPIQKPRPPILIGGGGEHKTLKLVAKYADACNLFGSPDTVRRKLGTLRDHCKAVGRDYDSILKTKLGSVIIGKDSEALKQKIPQSFKGLPTERLNEFIMLGTPEEIHRKIELFRDAGIDQMIVSFEPGRELDALNLFGEEVLTRF